MVRKLVKIQVKRKSCGWGGSWLEDDGDGNEKTSVHFIEDSPWYQAQSA